MNNGIKNKLKELIGKRVYLPHSNSGGFTIYYPVTDTSSYKVLRIEDDCVVLEDSIHEKYLSIDYISQITITKI